MRTVVTIISLFLVASVLSACFYDVSSSSGDHVPDTTTNLADFEQYAQATFAGGCFWCSESDFEHTIGVVEVVSGYIGGARRTASYKKVSSGKTKHREAVRVFYDPGKVTYQQLLDVFWRHTDPTDDGGSFGDRGREYTSAIFYHDEAQKSVAQASKEELERSEIFDEPIVTPILPVASFYPAEDYHQDYYKKNSFRYKFYRSGSGRDRYVEKTWGNELETAQRLLLSVQEKVTVDSE